MLWGLILIYFLIYPLLPVLAFESTQTIINTIFYCLSIIYIVANQRKNKKDFLDLIAVIFLINIVLSSFLFSNFSQGLFTLNKFLPLFIGFYLAKHCSDKESKSLLYTLVAGGFILSLYSLRSFFVLSEHLLRYLSEHKINYPFATEFLVTKRAFSPFITPNLLAGYLVMIIFLSCGLIFKSKGIIQKVFLGAGILLCLLVLFYTKSIGGWLTLIMSLGLFFLVSKKINKKTILLIFLLIILAVSVFIIRSENTLTVSKPLFSLQQRLSYWSDALETIRKQPFSGVGLGNFSSQESLYAHNSYLQIWAEMGLSGIILWLIICVVFIKMNLKIINNSENKLYAAAIFSVGLSFIIHNIIDFSFYVPEAAFIWWVIVGLSGRRFGNFSFDNHNNGSADCRNQRNEKS